MVVRLDKERDEDDDGDSDNDNDGHSNGDSDSAGAQAGQREGDRLPSHRGYSPWLGGGETWVRFVPHKSLRCFSFSKREEIRVS